MGKMSSGMRMMAMARASRQRDGRERFMDGNDHSTHMGGHELSPSMNAPEMRRQRDSRGRYMEGDDSPHMGYDGEAAQAYMPLFLDRPESRDHTYERHGGLMTGAPYQMRDKNIVNIRDYQDRRRIGFGANEGGDAEMRQYGRRYDPDRMSMYQKPDRRREEGHAESHDDGRLTREEAEKWVKSMKSASGAKGERWTLPEIEYFAGSYDVHGEDEIVELYAVMNALAADYGEIARKYGVDKVDFWAELAKAFMHDKDAVPGKVRVYYECVARHEDE